MATVGVLGTGTMGAGIVQGALQAGYRVVACDRSVEALEKAQRCARDGLARFARKGVISGGRRLERLRSRPLDGERARAG